MDQNEKLQKLTIVLTQSQIKISSLLKDQDRFLFARRWKNAFYIILEIVFYFVFISLVLFSVFIPSTPLKFKEALGHKSSVELSIHHDDISAIIYIVKSLIIICASGFLFAALFSRKARRRGYHIRNSAEKIKSVSDELSLMNN